MKKTTLLIILASVVLSLTVVLTAARGSRNRVVASNKNITKTLDITDFNAIETTGVIDIIYTQSNDVAASLTCPDNIIEYLDIRVKDNTLIIASRKNVNFDMKGKKIELIASSTSMNSIHVIGVGDVDIRGELRSDRDIVLNVTGVGDIESRNITCPKLTMAVSGAGDIVCDNINSTDVIVKISGAGDIECKNITATNVYTEINGAGDIDFRQITCDNIGAIVSGVGDIELRGSTNTGNYTVSGTGKISASQLEAKDVVAKVSGTGTIKCYATQTLSATTSELVGTILYRGNPKITTSNKRIRQITE